MPVPAPAPSPFQPADSAGLDLSRVATRLDHDVELPSLEKSQARLEQAQRRFWASRQTGLLLVFHGLDASGKDGTIRRLAQAMDPMGVRVRGFGVPTAEEAAHDFLWRVWPHLPGRGEVVIFNRSHYEAVLAERIIAGRRDAADDHQTWAHRFRVIREMEQHLVDSGTCILKFWLHVGAQEQRRRLLKRLDDNQRRWKFSPADVENWEQRERFLRAASEMIAQTHAPIAPWHLVPADDKDSTRRIVVARVADVLESISGDWPASDEELAARYRQRLEQPD